MSLDQNLFTLNFVPSKDDPNVTELVDPAERPHYRKERVLGSVYKMDVYGEPWTVRRTLWRMLKE